MMALILKLCGRVGRSINGGGGLFLLFGLFDLLRWENEREEVASSNGNEVDEAFVTPSELSSWLREGRMSEEPPIEDRLSEEAPLIEDRLTEAPLIEDRLTEAPLIEDRLTEAPLIDVRLSEEEEEGGSVNSPSSFSARGWNECKGAIGTKGSLSRIISRTLRADDDRAWRARRDGPTEEEEEEEAPTPLEVVAGSDMFMAEPNPNVVLVGGADGGELNPEGFPVLGRDKWWERDVEVEVDVDSGTVSIRLLVDGRGAGWDRRRYEEIETTGA
jgi:hypothetical protein